MKVLVISGGSGNDALIKGLKNYYNSIDVKVLVNAYDNGKSTGVCRSLTDTLGVSDVRKNHIRMYKAMTSNQNRCFIEFYEERYDFTPGYELIEIKQKLKSWNLETLIPYAEEFFQNDDVASYNFRDFNVSNIIYSQMYKSLGYEETNKYFCSLLGIDDFVILNSFDNVFIQAVTASDKVIADEGDIVEYCNSSDPIADIQYVGQCNNCLNSQAIEAIIDADYIVISTGTFWSSIYPTLQYGKLYQYINNSAAKKVWALNNTEDKDAFGVGCDDFINRLVKLGLNLNDFTLLINNDATDLLRQTNAPYKTVYSSMGNHNGKHDSNLYAREILAIYYGLDSTQIYDRYLFDFDDTLWSRKYTEDPQEGYFSLNNIERLNLLSGRENITIVSGNSFESIYSKLVLQFGHQLSDFNVDLWADANCNHYHKTAIVDSIDDLFITDEANIIVWYLEGIYGILPAVNDEDNVAYVKIKPIYDTTSRKILVDYLNDYLLQGLGCDSCIARLTGSTTVDILNKSNSKSKVFDKICSKQDRTLYIGDELDEGNDSDIAKLCTHSIHTSGVEETNCVIKLIEEISNNR